MYLLTTGRVTVSNKIFKDGSDKTFFKINEFLELVICKIIVINYLVDICDVLLEDALDKIGLVCNFL